MFTGLAAILNYELDKLTYSSAAPTIFFVYTILIAILPFLLAAVISFVVAAISSQAAKSTAKKQSEIHGKESGETETQPELEMPT